jgi:hypothetical protein
MSQAQPALRLEVLRQPGRRWFGLFHEQALLALRLQVDGQNNWTDCQFWGRVEALEPALKSAFIRLEVPGELVGLMKLPKKQKLLVGQRLMLRCLTEPRDGKGPKLTQAADESLRDFSDLGDWLIHRYQPRVLAASHLADQHRYAKRWPQLASQALEDASTLDEAIERARQDRVELGQGAWLLFEPGETLTAVDLNTGTLGFEAANAALIPVLAEHLRTRNLGGLIVVDAMEQESKPERAAFDRALKAAMKPDPLVLSIAPISAQGLVVIERRREGLSLDEALGLRRYRRAGDETRLLDALADAEHRLSIQDPSLALPADLVTLAAGHSATQELERRLGLAITLVAV